MEITLKTDDVQRVVNNADAITKRIQSGELIKDIGLALQQHIQYNASGRPGPNRGTGQLLSSIIFEMSPDKTQGVVGTNVFYAPFVEFGHSQTPGRFVRRLGKRLVNNFAPAYPFFMPAVESLDVEEISVTFGQNMVVDWMK